MSTGAIRLIAAERDRQINEEGWSPEHDDEHDDCSLTMAAHAYCYAAVGQANGICWPDVEANVPNSWPWADDWYKPSPDPVRNLVKAGALIAAEIDRLVRVRNAGLSSSPEPGSPPGATGGVVSRYLIEFLCVVEVEDARDVDDATERAQDYLEQNLDVSVSVQPTDSHTVTGGPV